VIIATTIANGARWRPAVVAGGCYLAPEPAEVGGTWLAVQQPAQAGDAWLARHPLIRKTGWSGAIASSLSSGESGPTPWKNMPTSNFHFLR
jgi:hypothetical protein